MWTASKPLWKTCLPKGPWPCVTLINLTGFNCAKWRQESYAAVQERRLPWVCQNRCHGSWFTQFQQWTGANSRTSVGVLNIDFYPWGLRIVAQIYVVCSSSESLILEVMESKPGTRRVWNASQINQYLPVVPVAQTCALRLTGFQRRRCLPEASC